MNTGDVVLVLTGKYRGCPLTFVGVDALGWTVCLNSNEVGGFVRVRKVEFLRPAVQFDPAKHCPVMERSYRSRIEFAKSCARI